MEKDPAKCGLVELPQAPVEAELTPAPLRRFWVKLQDCPQLVFEAVDAAEAVRLYREHCGILSTMNQFQVGEVLTPPAS
jgi:hypothetical protein